MQARVLIRLIGEVDQLRPSARHLRSPKSNHRSPNHLSPGRLASPQRPSTRLEFRKKQDPGSPCHRCVVRNIISEASQQQRSNSRNSRKLQQSHLQKSRSKSIHKRESMTSLEKLRRASELVKKHIDSIGTKGKHPSPSNSNSKRMQDQTVSMLVDNPSPDRREEERMRVKRDRARETQKRCSQLIRKKLELEQRQRQRLKSAIKIQAVWRGFLTRRRLQQQYERLLEQEQEFTENRHSIINGIKDASRSPSHSPSNSGKKPDPAEQMEKELEGIIQLKEQLRRQMEQIGQLKDRLQRKDKQRESYYVNYIQQLENKYRKKEQSNKSNSPSSSVKIEEGESEEQEHQRRDRIKGRVTRMLEAILEQRILHQLSEDSEVLKQGFCANLGWVRRYLSHMIDFICQNYRRECSSNVNKRFGFSCARRLALLREDLEEDNANSFSEQILHFVVPQNVFQEIEQSQGSEGEQKHLRRAVFDAINENLTTLRPFYRQSSEPYPWSVMIFRHRSIPLEEALKIVANSISESAKTLCGLIITLEPDIQNQLALRNRDWKIDVFERRQEQATQSILKQWVQNILNKITESPDWQYREDQKAEINIEISDWLLEQLVDELYKQITRSNRRRGLLL